MDIAARRISFAVVAGLLAVAVAACGGDPKTVEGAEETVEEFVEAFAEGEGDAACDVLTDDYADELVDEWNKSGFGDQEDDCEDAVEAGRVLVEAFDEDGSFEIDDISADVDGSEATVTVVYAGDAFDEETYLLVYDDGEWLIDDDDGDGVSAPAD